ncbi:MAG: Uma2 family endonuclease [Planctomycetaceae bacterium]
MNSAVRPLLQMTEAEYISWERQQPERHEYWRGEVFCQAGGTRRHSLVGTNTAGAVSQLLKGHDCQAHGSDMRVHIEATGYHAYPDVSVVCPPIEGDEDDEISNPVLVVEVLSPSTADFDRGGKFGHYRQIPSLQEYLVLWQDEPRAEQHTRTEDGLWLLREVVGIDQTLQLASLNKQLALRDVYDKVQFADSAQ